MSDPRSGLRMWHLTHSHRSIPYVQVSLTETATGTRAVYQGMEMGCCSVGLVYTPQEARQIGQELIRLADEMEKDND